jgi:hypothetical protein
MALGSIRNRLMLIKTYLLTQQIYTKKNFNPMQQKIVSFVIIKNVGT